MIDVFIHITFEDIRYMGNFVYMWHKLEKGVLKRENASIRLFWLTVDIGGAAHCGWCHPLADDLGCDIKADWSSHQKQDNV